VRRNDGISEVGAGGTGDPPQAIAQRCHVAFEIPVAAGSQQRGLLDGGKIQPIAGGNGEPGEVVPSEKFEPGTFFR